MEKLSIALGQFHARRTMAIPMHSRVEKRTRAEVIKDLRLCEPLCTFANFEPVAGTARAYNEVRALADGTSDKTMILCCGSSGCGKTHLLKAAILRLFGRGTFVRYIKWSEIIGYLKDGLNDGAIPPYRARLANYCYSGSLVIDDVGMGSTGTDWEYSQLEEIIDCRYSRRLLTLLATNHSWKDLPDRIVSRLRDPEVGLIVVNQGQDYRHRGKL